MGRAAETLPVDFVENFRGYHQPLCTDTAAVICYFNACEYKTPLANALKVVGDLRQAGIPLYLVELCYGDQPGAMPEPTMRLRARSWMFHKENLFNVITPHIPAQYTKLIYLDNDVRFNCADWLDRASRVLDRCDVMQPMDWCYWSDTHNRQAMAVRVVRQDWCDPGSGHPGFAVGARREWLESVGGFFEQAFTGSGDACLWHAIGASIWNHHQNRHCGYAEDQTQRWLTKFPGYAEYVAHMKKHPPRVGYTLACSIGHMPHGTHKNRRYWERVDGLPAGLQTVRNNNHIHEWRNPADQKRAEEYFRGRKEDSNDN